MTISELFECGFGKWDDISDLFLIPIWLYHFINEDVELTSLYGYEKSTIKDGIDKDHRLGYLAYCIIKKN